MKFYFKIKGYYIGVKPYNMKMTEEEFDDKFTATLDALLIAMAEDSEIDPKKFYSMTCILENLRFFSPVLYGAIRKPGKD
ncbi:hypothetical protein [Pontibacter harenae]|uniref:hypothetical protein n=1 Tax=Pontibacter harenae TaxID=2894083 RepID=UPI001E382043|nr:hypothetical protein [Pontibacter harenae]MCC9168608.1 hypothetical protein [Pontibacter harenae]